MTDKMNENFSASWYAWKRVLIGSIKIHNWGEQ
jgi:hypothetical protein